MALAARALAVLVAASAATSLAAIPLAEGDVAPPSPAGCDAHQTAALLTTRGVIVYSTAAGTNRLGQSVTRYWACVRPNGPFSKLGRNASGGTRPPAETTTHLAAAGSYVGALQSSRRGFAEVCPPAGHKPCLRFHHQVVLTGLATGDRGTASCEAHVGRLLVGAAGPNRAALVWTQPAGRSRVAVAAMVISSSTRGPYGSGETSSGIVAQGAIAPRSLRLTGLRLRFTEAGRPRSVSLTRY